jgi:hypothetical protein
LNKFSLIVAISAFLISSVAAFFSVTGIGMLFSGSFVAVCVMASALELGKLVTASFLYRYWKVVNLLQKFYMTISVIVLIGITSMGIFGFLSNSYMGATVEFETMTTKLSVYKDQLEMVLEDKKFLKQELEASVSSLPDNYITAKRKLRNEYNPLIQNKSVVVGELKQKIGALEIQMVDTGIDIGPLIYISEAFDTDIDTAVKWIIMILICVFDPLAVLLVISFNMTLLRDENDYEIYKKEEINKDKVVTIPDTEEEQLKRMDIIAQNGNEGLHYTETDIVEDDLEIDTEDTTDEVIGIRRGGSDGYDGGRNG